MGSKAVKKSDCEEDSLLGLQTISIALYLLFGTAPYRALLLQYSSGSTTVLQSTGRVVHCTVLYYTIQYGKRPIHPSPSALAVPGRRKQAFSAVRTARAVCDP